MLGIAANLKVNGQIMSNPTKGLDIRALNRLFLFTYLALNTRVMTVLDERLEFFFFSFDPVKHLFQSLPRHRLCVAPMSLQQTLRDKVAAILPKDVILPLHHRHREGRPQNCVNVVLFSRTSR